MLALGDTDGDTLADTPPALGLGLTDALSLIDGDMLGLTEGLTEAEILALGDTETETLGLTDGDTDGL